MDDETDAESESDAESEAKSDFAPESADDEPSPTEMRLRRLSGHHGTFRGEIIASTRGWVSRDGRLHAFAARFLDFAVLTNHHLILCSTGFFTRRPRRRVFKEPLERLMIVGIGPEPALRLRIAGNFSHPILLELKADETNAHFARELLARTPSPTTETEADPTADESGEPDARDERAATS